MSKRLQVPLKGRGAVSTLEGRFESEARESVHDGWDLPEEEAPPLPTVVSAETARSIITRNQSPDLPFEQSVNPYRGCEHGCIYCYARPSHAYLNLSPGLDFETRLFYKRNAAELLERELSRPGYRCSVISLGSNTDAYQPIEREHRVTRALLEVMLRYRQPVWLITKSTLVERDLDLLAEMARLNLVSTAVSVTSLDDRLKRTLEPRTASPAARLRTIERLAAAGIPVSVMFSPVIPYVNDADMEAVLKQAADAGARSARYVFLRLPHELAPLFREWLDVHYPQRAAHVMSLVQQSRGGKDYDADFATRMQGQGEYAQVIEQRFRLACRRLGLDRDWMERLDVSGFRVPPKPGDQIGLF